MNTSRYLSGRVGAGQVGQSNLSVIRVEFVELENLLIIL
jgi:hypothetical protein